MSNRVAKNVLVNFLGRGWGSLRILGLQKKTHFYQASTFEELVKEMVREDLKTAERDELVKSHGYLYECLP